MNHTPADATRILAFGDSLTAGFLIPAASAYPARLEAALHQAGRLVRVANQGVCGDACPDAMARLDRVLRQPWDMALVGLGINDALMGRPPERIRADLGAIVQRLQNASIPVLLLGMRLPPAWAAAAPGLAEAFQSLYPELAEETGAALHPDFLGPALDRELLLDDGLHPSAAGMEAMAVALHPAVERLARLGRRDGGE